MFDWIGKWADYTPHKVAVSALGSDNQYTYAQLDGYANTLSGYLTMLGLSKGDRIAVLAEHGLPYMVLFAACQRAGIILVPLNYRYATTELDRILKDCNPSLLVYDYAQLEKFVALGELPAEHLSMDTLIEIYSTPGIQETSTYQIAEDDTLFIFYTSGTTGRPKGVIYTNRMLFWNSLNTSMQLGITFRDATLNVAPPYHTSGWNVFVTPLLHKGGHVTLMNRFDPDQVLFYLEQQGTTLFMALPTMLGMMQESPVFKQVRLKKLRYIITGGEAVPHEMVMHWKQSKGLKIRPGYGLTEAGPSITSLHHNMVTKKPGSIGKPNFYLDARIVNDKGAQVAPDEVGELCIRGDVVTPGYWNNSVETNNKIKEGWLYTGDYAQSDVDGYIYLKGRKNDMYISGGENIYPQEIEIVLNGLSGIGTAVVFPIKDVKWGECGVAFVTLNDPDWDQQQIRERLQGLLAPYKHPKYIFILEQIPRTSLGKVSRKKLRAYLQSVMDRP
jgi:fatty-acyl-CoA synthase